MLQMLVLLPTRLAYRRPWHHFMLESSRKEKLIPPATSFVQPLKHWAHRNRRPRDQENRMVVAAGKDLGINQPDTSGRK
jgi:hypothetical protein